MQRLDRLIGRWRLEGRSLGSKTNNIRGEITISPILGGRYLELRGTMSFQGSPEFGSLEIVHYDESRDVYPSLVYTDLGDLTGAPPVAYEWALEEDTVVHRGAGATYEGRFNERGDVLEGGWRPDAGGRASDEGAYDLRMTRTASR
jgi:hypothetical protein